MSQSDTWKEEFTDFWMENETNINGPAVTYDKIVEFISITREEVKKEVIDKAFDWIWGGWNLDLSTKDRAKEHFLSKESEK